MKKRIWTSALREVKNSRSRFFSILAIVGIGVGFFGGVKATGPDMVSSADAYYHDYSLMDFRLLSTVGFSENDIDSLREIDGINVWPSQFTDCIETVEGTDEVVRVYGYDDSQQVNRLELLSGRLPENEHECLVDGSGFHSNAELGSTVTLTGDGDTDLSDTLKNTSFTVVGTFETPMYVSGTGRGSTTVGDGSISDIIYISMDNFTADYYTQIYITVDELAQYTAYSAEYEDARAAWIEKLKQVGDMRAPLRLQEVTITYGQQITDGRQALEDGKQELLDARTQLTDAFYELERARLQLADARIELENSRTQLDDGWDAYNSGVASLEAGLNDAKAQYAAGLATYNSGKAQLDSAIQSISNDVRAYDLSPVYDRAQDIIDNTDWEHIDITAAEAAINASTLPAAQKQQLLDVLDTVDPSQLRGQLNTALADLRADTDITDEIADSLLQLKDDSNPGEAIARANQLQMLLDDYGSYLPAGTLDTLRSQLNNYITLMQGKQTLNSSLAAINAAQADADAQLSAARAKLEDGEQQYADGLAEYQDGLRQYQDGLQAYYKKSSEAAPQLVEAHRTLLSSEVELRKAEDALNNLAEPTWYVFTRDDNPGYTEYGENAQRIANIAKIFPVLFLLVAALVCLTTMSRMVEEQRTQIGTLKALGYSNGIILAKYMLYALCATVIGAFLGLAIGFQLFPRIIISSYAILYRMPYMLTPFSWPMTLTCTGAAVLCIGVTVFFSCHSESVQMPSQLMRPKTPPQGKRILLERIPFLWKRFNFSQKVSARNIFRYKKRMLMAVIGISGCTALVVTGFGLKDSISDIVTNQFEHIWQYQATVVFDPDATTEEDFSNIDLCLKRVDDNATSLKVMQKNYTASADGGSCDVTLLVPEDFTRLPDFISQHDRLDRIPYDITDDMVIITEKMSALLGVQTGDSFTLKNDSGESVTLTISKITENYAYHYIYLSPDTYQKLFGNDPAYNSLLCRYASADANAESQMSTQLLSNEHIVQISLLSSVSSGFQDMIGVLNLVVVVLIVSAGALAFVVMYNLTNINITERIREIATLKVLGFNGREVSAYIFRENIILTLMGTFCGLFLGHWMGMTVITTAEIDIVMFGRSISALSYVYAAVITLAFSVLVSLFMRRNLEHISMVESLKSVE